MFASGGEERTIVEFPQWLVRAIKVYYLEVRPNFIKRSGAGRLLRAFRNDKRTVTTEHFFVNSNGQYQFRAAVIANQYRQKVSIHSRI